MSGELQPPETKHHALEDTGAHELASSDDGSDDFVDASEGERPHIRPGGTPAYNNRIADAVPDEIEVVPEGTRSRSASRVSRPSTPGGTRIPRMIVEKIDPDVPSYGDVPGTAAYEMRKADAEPDEIVRSPDSARAPANPFKASPTASNIRSTGDLDRDQISLDDRSDDPGGGEDEADDGGFGDDFDDFEEGQEANADDDDFGEFDEGFSDEQTHAPPDPSQPPSLPSIPIADFRDANDIESIQSICAPYLRALFPSYPPTTSSSLPPPNQQIFLSERSASLYSQLIAPPPLAPPNWLRSRIRRLFLVSLGVPVDLDEILPASKQKKLVLPSGLLKSPDPNKEKSPRPSSDDRSQLGKLKAGHDSDASLTSTASGKQRKSRRKAGNKEVEQPPEFDTVAARRLAQTTQERIDGMSDKELKEHIKEVERMNEKGREYLGYWQRKVEEAGREKEAFEGVIENLVNFARKVRK
ncbi:hypothetical protein, variant 2 [Verruconis gallopava]|uniref:Uncharacterized protein n=1 Tax=Verruconis gallopava TaxID=253628 RepID=A0A0D1Y0R8_9PEZI|nr:hypothetical protein, variant 2 [Verruconis gallopava]KIW08671.1 hypothetical protein, variant 2 [Verruconis gallopava]